MENENKNYKTLTEFINPNPEPSDNSSSFCQGLLKKVQVTSSVVKKVKIVEDHEYFLSQNKSYENLLNKTSKKIEKLILQTMIFGKKITDKNDLPNIRKNFDHIVNFADDLLEKVSDNIDILKGIRKDKKDEEIENELKIMKRIEKKDFISKQNFTDKFCDNTYNFFIPKIKIKHNKLKELSEEISKLYTDRENNYDKIKNIIWEERKNAYNAKIIENPYNYEISVFFNEFSNKSDMLNKEFLNYQRNFTIKSNEDSFFQEFLNTNKIIKMEEFKNENEFKQQNVFHRVFYDNYNIQENLLKEILNPKQYLYKDLQQTNYLYIETYDNWKIMLEDIRKADEIAVDLEHHHLESYIGVVCLMQISTRFTDYIVDTIKLREFIYEINEVFTNPSILKVLHGADFDIMWLQRDFGVYMVNMFDTGQAAKILDYQSFGLAFLLNKFCDVNANKIHQKDDWRIRPLTEEMLKYAREDTHYLLYIYDCIKKQLFIKSFKIERPIFNTFTVVMERSKDLCLKKYFKPEIKDYSYYGLISRNAMILSKIQMSVFKILYKFRDYVARKSDCSPDSVLYNNKLFSLAKLTEWKIEEFYKICDKSPLRNFLPELLKLIQLKQEKVEIQKTKKENHEENYINDVKSRLAKNTLIINNNTSNPSFVNKINNFTSVINTEIKKSEQNKFSEEKKFSEEIDKLSNTISMKVAKNNRKSKLFEDNSIKIDKTNDSFKSIIEKFDNFNLVTYLREKHNLQNLKIAPIKPKHQPIIEKENEVLKTTIPKVSKSTINERFLGTKRHSEIDLTSIDPKNMQNNEEDISSDEKEVGVKEQFIGFEQTKNFLASSKFMENIINKNTEIKSFKPYQNKNFHNNDKKNSKKTQ